MKTKRCSTCCKDRPLDMFGNNRLMTDGLSRICKPCVRNYEAQRADKTKEYRKQYSEINSDTLAARAAAWNAEHKEQAKKHRKEWYDRNKDKISARTSEKRSERTQAVRERERAQRAKNPESIKAKNAKRRAHELSSGNFTPDEWERLLDHYDHKCLCCGTTKRLTPDHVVPLSLNGSNTIDNIQPLCFSCNSRKGTRTTDYR